jgi:transposase
VVGRWHIGTSKQSGRRRRKKKNPLEPEDHGLGRSRGGSSSKVHLLCDRWGHPLHFEVTAGQSHESLTLMNLIEDAEVVDHDGESIGYPQKVAGDKAYRADWIDDYLQELGIEPVVPTRQNQSESKRGIPWDRKVYRHRNVIERLIGWLKECRRIGTRFEKTALNFAGFIKMAFIQRYLKIICL